MRTQHATRPYHEQIAIYMMGATNGENEIQHIYTYIISGSSYSSLVPYSTNCRRINHSFHLYPPPYAGGFGKCCEPPYGV